MTDFLHIQGCLLYFLGAIHFTFKHWVWLLVQASCSSGKQNLWRSKTTLYVFGNNFGRRLDRLWLARCFIPCLCKSACPYATGPCARLLVSNVPGLIGNPRRQTSRRTWEQGCLTHRWFWYQLPALATVGVLAHISVTVAGKRTRGMRGFTVPADSSLCTLYWRGWNSSDSGHSRGLMSIYRPI